MQWLTPEIAIAQTGISVSASELHDYPKQSSEGTTPEERFASLGLLFDRNRYDAAEPAFLALLQESSEKEGEPHDLEQCTVRIVLTILPPEQDKPRQVMVAASTHDDLPVAQVVSLSDLEPLPQPIQDILAQLAEDLPHRRYRAQIKQAKAQKQSKPRRPKPQPESTSTEPTTTQINLFGL